MSRARDHISVIASLIVAATVGSVVAANAESVSVSAFNSFHVQNHGSLPHTPNPYLCLYEENGAVVNNCKDPVNLAFDLPVNTSEVHTIAVRGYYKIATGTSFICTAYAYPGNGQPSPNFKSATISQANQLVSVSTTNTGLFPNIGDIALICWNVPPNDGVGMINYNP